MRKSGGPVLTGILFLVLSVFMGCGPKGNVVSKTYQTQCWAMEDTLTGTFEVKNVSDKHLMFFPLTVTDDYPYYNLFLRAEIISPSGKKSEPEQLEFRLLDPDGKWVNDCEGKQCPFALEWGQNRVFEETGTHTVKLYHYMRDQPLCGISQVGVEVTPQ